MILLPPSQTLIRNRGNKMPQNRNRRDDYAAYQKNRISEPVSCALILAGGEGKRLRPFVHLLRGDLLPKQYVNFIGRRSMLEHTLDRAERLVPRQRVFTIVNRNHLDRKSVV